jgi:hypothetical protein
MAGAPKPGYSRRARRPFRLEVLEDRTLLSSFPVATPDFSDTDGTHPVAISVLANDAALGGHTHIKTRSVTLVSLPANGTATVNATTGQITYKAFAGFSGTDSFTYTFQDKAGNTSNAATVTVRVNRPQANDDFADTDGTHPVTVPVLQNDSDPDGHGALRRGGIAIVSGPHHGTVSVNPLTGQVTYRATGNFDGTDSFTYTVGDIHGARSNPAVVVIQVHHPLADDDFAIVTAGSSTTIDVLANDSDPDGSQHLVPGSVHATAFPLHGRVTIDHTTGAIQYTPIAGFVGIDTFQYNLRDDNGAASVLPATVTVAVNGPPSQTRPTAEPDVIDTDGTNPVTISVLANDFAPNGIDPHSVTIGSNPSHGTVSVDPNTGQITYTAFAGFGRTDTFTYFFKDSHGMVSSAGTVAVSVHLPHASDDYADTDGTTPVAVDVLANDSDPDGVGQLAKNSVTIVSGPSHGTVSVDPTTGQITYTAVAGFGSTDSFQYTVRDIPGATSNPATVTIQVHLPTAVDDQAVIDGSNPTPISVLANDSDPDGVQHLVPGSVTITTAPQHGSVSVNSNGQVIYTANSGFTGTDSFQYTVGDDNGAVSSPATVAVNVVAPTAFDFAATTRAGQGVTIAARPIAFDPLGATNLDPSSVQIFSQPINGTVTINRTTGQLHYVPNAGFTGTDTFWYQISTKGGTASDWGQITITVI